ncbi:MAG: hypothetical protein CSA33_04995 [Desulfobulbus propionicus]|nr:MAG: hypothetical protein CSA33_04995 [Desulfobulbus propionicus]
MQASGLRLRLANNSTIEVDTGFSTTTHSALLSTYGVHSSFGSCVAWLLNRARDTSLYTIPQLLEKKS